MAATFSNPRWDALPCERMRGCSFADDFLTLERTEQNNGTDTGTGNVFDRGLTLDGNGRVQYDVVAQAGTFSVVVRLSAAALLASPGLIIGNVNATYATWSTVPAFVIWADTDGIKATHRNALFTLTELSVDVNYSDGEIHTITYTVDQVGNTRALYVDALDADTGTSPSPVAVGGSSNLLIGGNGTDDFIGTIHSARIFDALLTEEEHDAYHADTLETFFWSPLAAYRCDAFCDDAVGNLIWDRTTERRDLIKGDGSTAAGFPTLGLLPTEHYVFDGANDYVSGVMTLPDEYTITAAKSTQGYLGFSAYPEVVQHNDETFMDLVTAAGGYAGFLHSLIIHTGVLTAMELLADEYQHLYWLWRGRAYGAYHRLITEGTCSLAMFLDWQYKTFDDVSRNDATGAPSDVTQSGADGCTFPNAASHIEVPHDTSLQAEELTIAILGTFAGSEAAGTIVDKGTNYKFLTNGNQLDFNGSTIAHTFADNQHIAVTIKTGFKPRFFVDGIYIGEGTTTETLDDTDTTDLTIGNNNEENSRTQYPIKHVYIGDAPLTDVEILALYEQALMIGATPMALGTLTPVTGTLSYLDAGGEQTIFEDTASAARILFGIAFDTTNLTNDGTFKIYQKVDGTNYRQIDDDIDFVAADDDTIYINAELASDSDIKITYTEGSDEGAARDIPFSYVVVA